MSKRYLITRTHGGTEDVGAETIDFTPTHIVFESDNGKKLEYAILASLVIEVVEDTE